MTISSFELDLQRFVDKATGQIGLVVRSVTLDVFSRVISKSPTDTGRFKGNWQAAINATPTGILDTTDKSGAETIAKVRSELAEMKAGDSATLLNNLPYSRSLEYGHSKQAPAGMVRVTAAEFPMLVKSSLSEVS